MAEQQGKNILRSLRQRWRLQGIAYCLLLALAASLLLTGVLHQWLQWPLWAGLLMLLVLFGIALLFFPYWRISLQDITRQLDNNLPQLEESCGLLLKPVEELGPLERLQVVRTEAALASGRMPHPLQKKLLLAVALLAGAGLVYAGFERTAGKRSSIPPSAGRASPPNPLLKLTPGIRSADIRITPPAYTGRSLRQQQDFNLQVEEGAVVNWELTTDAPADSLQFIFNDTVKTVLSPINWEHTRWAFTGPIRRPGFYQVKLHDRLSDLYKIEVIQDEPPHIIIRTPKPYTVVDFGESQKIPLVVRLEDDYGIADATIVATIASGSGEAVKFKEQILGWDRSFTGHYPAYDLQKTLDLAALGLKPGDELYFYCRAKDNREQESRSDMYIISLPDTARLMSLDGLTMGMDIKPEYFRSERQIILETEQLLREKDTIPLSAFNNRSNDLGFDQKLLRLRYGKFLGEEAEEGVPGGGHDNDTYAPGDFGNAAKILDAYTDKHDNAEDATYFEPAIKAQLKATLTEMWNAELRLRTYKPAEALPYAYKALRLLKDLQQKSRAYVAKTGVRVTPLDPAKRLSGKLEAIVGPRQFPAAASSEPGPADILRISLSLLEQWGKETMRSRASLEVLQRAGRELGRQAAAHPAEYLAGYQAMRRILSEGQPSTGAGGARTSGVAGSSDTAGSTAGLPGTAGQPSTGAGAAGQPATAGAGATGQPATAGSSDILLAQQAIRKMLPEAEATPSKGKAPADAGLSQLYFSNLNTPSRKQ